MSIPEEQERSNMPEAAKIQGATLYNTASKACKDWVLVGIVLLTGTLGFGLGLLAGKENAKADGDKLWIEQLPAQELPGSISSTTSANATSAETTEPAQIKTTPSPTPVSQTAAAAALPQTQTGKYVASKTGTKYYLPTCGTAKRIKDENKVWFSTQQEAEAAGYAPGANCPGL